MNDRNLFSNYVNNRPTLRFLLRPHWEYYVLVTLLFSFLLLILLFSEYRLLNMRIVIFLCLSKFEIVTVSISISNFNKYKLAPLFLAESLFAVLLPSYHFFCHIQDDSTNWALFYIVTFLWSLPVKNLLRTPTRFTVLGLFVRRN